MTIEGAVAVEECIAFLQTAAPLPPLALSAGLCAAASAHLEDIGPKGLATHVGSDNSSMQVRLTLDRVNRKILRIYVCIIRRDIPRIHAYT
jgi:uncharacterized protein YkwD